MKPSLSQPSNCFTVQLFRLNPPRSVFVFRFCFNSTPAERREKLQVNVNIKDIFAKKKATNVV